MIKWNTLYLATDSTDIFAVTTVAGERTLREFRAAGHMADTFGPFASREDAEAAMAGADPAASGLSVDAIDWDGIDG